MQYRSRGAQSGTRLMDVFCPLLYRETDRGAEQNIELLEYKEKTHRKGYVCGCVCVCVCHSKLPMVHILCAAVLNPALPVERHYKYGLVCLLSPPLLSSSLLF